VIEIHDLFLLFLPRFPGAPGSERLLLPRRAAAFWEGPKRFRGRNRESRRREDRWAQELARSSAQENEERKKKWLNATIGTINNEVEKAAKLEYAHKK
jgi:hypothetical protein